MNSDMKADNLTCQINKSSWPEDITPEERLLIRHFRELNDDEQSFILRAIRSLSAKLSTN